MGNRLKKRISLYLPTDLLDQLDEYSQELGLDRNTIIHCAIEDVLEEEKATKAKLDSIPIIKKSITLERIVEDVYEGNAKYDDPRLRIKTPSETEKMTTIKAQWMADQLQKIKEQIKKDSQKK